MKTSLRTLVPAATLVLAVLALAGCGDDPTFPPEFDESLGIDLDAMTRTSSGLYYEDLVLGEGEMPAQGDSVHVSYTGWLADGRMFDTGTFWRRFIVEPLIPGFEEGLSTMQVGGKRKLVIPPELGYGASGSGPIPGNATLVFELELLALIKP